MELPRRGNGDRYSKAQRGASRLLRCRVIGNTGTVLCAGKQLCCDMIAGASLKIVRRNVGGIGSEEKRLNVN